MIRTLSLGLAAATLCVATVGCGTGIVSEAAKPKSPISAGFVGLSGNVMGGEQPIVGATMGLYQANITGTYASAATNILTGGPYLTNSSGGFYLPAGSFTCSTPTSTSLLLLIATGGTSGLNQGPNANIINMVALGQCSALGQYSHIGINELSTIAAAYALQGFMSSPSNIGTPSTNITGLINAMNASHLIVNPYYGQVPGLLPAGATENQAEINTLADILVSCVNSTGGTAGDGMGNGDSSCGTLFDLTPNSSGTYPTDTATAAVNMAQHPGTNVMALIVRAGSYQPFTPTISSANDLTIAIRYTTASIASPVGIAADQSGNVWVASTGSTPNVTELSPTGAVLSGTTGYASGSTGNGALAIDLNGNAWTAGTTGSLVKISSSGTATSYTGGGLSTTNSIAVDGSGTVWAAGSGSTLSAFNSSTGAALSSTGYTGGGTSNAQSIAITPH